MPTLFSPENRDTWQALADKLSITRPSVGKNVKVASGKHAGFTGKVVWHGLNKFDTSRRYCTDAQFALREMAGRHGYRVGILSDDGIRIFVDADKVEVVA